MTRSVEVRRIFEARPVWYTGPNRAESYPRSELAQRIEDYGRKPDAIGIYERVDGGLIHVTDEHDVDAAERFIEEFTATLAMVR